MIQALVLIATYIIMFVRWIAGLGASGSAGTAVLGVLVGSVIFKVLDYLALGFVTFQISNSLIDNLIALIRDQLTELNSFQFIPDLIATLHLPQALSMLISAISIALTIGATRTFFRVKQLKLF